MSSGKSGSPLPDPVRRRGHAIHGHVVRFDRQFLNDLAVKPKCPAAGVGPEPRQKSVIMTGRRGPADNSGGQTQDPARAPNRFLRVRWGDSGLSVRGSPGCRVRDRVLGSRIWNSRMRLPLPIDPGKNDSLTGLQGVNEKRPGLKLFGESLRVEQDGTCFGITGKLVEEPDKSSLLGRSFLRIEGQDQRPGGTPQSSFLRWATETL